MESVKLTPLTMQDVANFAEINAEVIRKALLSLNDFSYSDSKHGNYQKELIEKMLDRMKISLPSITMFFQSQPSRFYYLFLKEIGRVSESVKREEGLRLSNYDVEADIKSTRDFVDRQLANELKMEVTLWSLYENQQYDQALTIIEALEIERKDKDLVSRFELLNWKVETLARIGNEQYFFETISAMIDFKNHPDVESIKYNVDGIKGSIAYILSKKFEKGIPISLNILGRVEMKKDPMLPEKVGNEFHNLLFEKIIIAIFEDNKINSPKSLNDFLKNEWRNIVSSFKLINRYVDQILLPAF